MKAIIIIPLFILFSCYDYEPEIRTASNARIESTPKNILYVMFGQSNVGYYTALAMGNEYATGVKGWDQKNQVFVDSLSWKQCQTGGTLTTYKWSPLIGLANKLLVDSPDSLHFMAVFQAGTNLYQDWSVIQDSYRRGQRYNQLKNNLIAATAQVQFDEIIGIWVQGESDCANELFATTYQVNEDTLFSKLKSQFNISKFLVYKQHTGAAYQDTVVNAKYYNEANRTDVTVITIPVITTGPTATKTYATDTEQHMTKYGVRVFIDSLFARLQ